MSSKFGWVDFAEEDRQRMLKVIKVFSEHDTRDEMGIGSIRDAFANYFFPGTSTIQTRVRYMLFIPWIYRNLERKQVPSRKITRRARNDEVKLIYALLKADDTDGVIGQESKKKLQRLPSSIYWAGLGSWGIRLFPGSQAQYHRALDSFYQLRQRKTILRSEVDQELAIETVTENWDPGLPDPPDDFLDQAELLLTQEEAQYLQDRIRLCHPDSLLALLVSQSHWTEADFPWEHQIAGLVPPGLQQDLRHAQNFSETIYGAALLYNLMLARKRSRQQRSNGAGELAAITEDEAAALADKYESFFNQWAANLAGRRARLLEWHTNLAAFWRLPALQVARIPPPTRSFVERWLQLVFDNFHQLSSLADDPAAQRLIQEREIKLKKPDRARLYDPRALERWVGYSGLQQLEYRWSTARTFARDIITALHPQEVPHA